MASYSVILRQGFDIKLGVDVAASLQNLSADPRDEAGNVSVTLGDGTVVDVPASNVLAVIEAAS